MRDDDPRVRNQTILCVGDSMQKGNMSGRCMEPASSPIDRNVRVCCASPDAKNVRSRRTGAGVGMRVIYASCCCGGGGGNCSAPPTGGDLTGSCSVFESGVQYQMVLDQIRL